MGVKNFASCASLTQPQLAVQCGGTSFLPTSSRVAELLALFCGVRSIFSVSVGH